MQMFTLSYKIMLTEVFCMGFAGHATSPGMQMFTLRRLRPAVAWLANFQRLQRKYMRHSLSIFSTSRTALRVQALLFIRHMATLIPDPAMDQALKVSPFASSFIFSRSNALLFWNIKCLRQPAGFSARLGLSILLSRLACPEVGSPQLSENAWGSLQCIVFLGPAVSNKMCPFSLAA